MHKFNTQTKTLERIAKLPEPLLGNSESIRAAITVEDTLLVATTSGVYVKNINNLEQSLRRLDYLGDIPENLDNANAKFLLLDDKDRVWISTVSGVFVAQKQDFLKQVQGEKEHVFTGSIWQKCVDVGSVQRRRFLDGH